MTECANCGESFLPAYPSQEHCSTTCRKEAQKKPRRNNGRIPGFEDPQRRCRVEGCTRRADHQHHVVLRQHVENAGGDVGDSRNALGVCEHHHTRHHKRIRPIRVNELRAENIEYAQEMYGQFASDYLLRYYGV